MVYIWIYWKLRKYCNFGTKFQCQKVNFCFSKTSVFLLLQKSGPWAWQISPIRFVQRSRRSSCPVRGQQRVAGVGGSPPREAAAVSRKISTKLGRCRDLQAYASPTHLPKVLITFCLWEGRDGNEGRQRGEGRGSGRGDGEKVGGSRLGVEKGFCLSPSLSLSSFLSGTHTCTHVLSLSLFFSLVVSSLSFFLIRGPCSLPPSRGRRWVGFSPLRSRFHRRSRSLLRSSFHFARSY